MFTLNIQTLPWVNIFLELALNVLVVAACFSVRRGKIAFGIMAACFFTVIGIKCVQGVSQNVIAILEGLSVVAGIVFSAQYFRAKFRRQDSEK